MTTTRQRLSAPQRRLRIEDEAGRLFAQRGIEATTMDDIAAAAGVTKPVVYRHFASKKALHLHLLRRHREELAGAALDELAAAADRGVQERVRAMIEAWFAHIEAHPYAWRMLFADTTGDPDVLAVLDELHGLQRAADVALLRELAPQIPPDELEPLGEVIRSSLSGLALWWLEHPEVARETLVRAMARIAMGLMDSRR
jgi:AcrR family transcriptional regulator